MIISILAAGTRGDVQPPAALAIALAARGHEVRLIAEQEFAGLVEGTSVAFKPIPGDIRGQLQSPEGRAFFESGGNPLGFLRWFIGIAKRSVRDTTPLARDYAAGSDVIVGTGLMVSFANALALHFKTPCVYAYMQPSIPTRDFPLATIPPPPFALPGWANRLTARLYFDGIWLASRSLAKLMHELLGIAPPPLIYPLLPQRNPRGQYLLAHSEALLPRAKDWPANVDVTGFWFLDRPANWQPPQALERFLAAGPAPIYVGFGSMMMKDPAATVAAVLEAIRVNNCRAVISAGWGDLKPTDLPPTVFAIDAIPHDWLFPQLAAVVHHGGAGTTGAALKAGVPQVVVPFISDQFFWAGQLHKHGVAPPGIRHAKLTAPALAEALRIALTDPAMRETAAQLGARIRSEDGAGRAAALVERAAI